MIRRCRFEQQVQRAVTADRWTPALMEHAKECQVCGEIRMVAAALRPSSLAVMPVAAPRVLWTTAKLARRFAMEARISLVVMAIQVLVLVTALGVLLSFVNWQTIRAWTTWRVPAEGDVWASVALAIGTLVLVALSRGADSMTRD